MSGVMLGSKWTCDSCGSVFHSIYCSKPDGVSELWTHNRCEGHDTHSAKLVGVRPIEEAK